MAHKKSSGGVLGRNQLTNVSTKEAQVGFLFLSLYSIELQILDLGISFHASPNKVVFKNYTEGVFKNVQFGDNKVYNLLSKGDVDIEQLYG